jgi:AcrR family transcriptional regulator
MVVDTVKPKEKIIMEASIKLFGKKGYDATSVQEIVNEAGISKGAFYLYYKSKEALLLSIFQYYYESFQEKFKRLREQDLPPRELFVEQVITQYQFIIQQKEFLIMQARERVIPFNESIGKMLNLMRLELIQVRKNSLTTIYGEKITPHIWDLTMLVEGVMHPYLELLLFGKFNIELRELAEFILKRTDDMAKGLIQSNETPLISESIIKDMDLPFHSIKLEKRDLLTTIREAKEMYSDDSDLMITIEVIEEEIMREEPRIPVIEGMLGNLKKENKLPELQEQINELFQLNVSK